MMFDLIVKGGTLPDGTVLELPLTPTARVQVIHNSPSPTVDGRRPRQSFGVPISSISSWRVLAAFEQLDGSARHDRRDRMLVDKLRMAVAPEQQTEIVKPGDNALQLHPIDQKDRQWRFGFANVIEKRVL